MPDNKTAGMPLLKASILVILLFQICALFFRGYTYVHLESGGMAKRLAEDLSWLLVPLTLGILMAPILKKNWPTIKALLQVRRLTIRLILVSVALGISLRLAYWGGLIGNAGFQILTFSGPESPYGPIFGFNCPSPPTLALAILVSVIMIPVIEELINRGFFLHGLLKRGRWTAIVGSSVLFGIFHAPQMIGPAIIIGIFLALQYLNAQTLWASIITHSTYNALVIVDRNCLTSAWNPTEVTAVSAAVGVLAIALMVMSLLVTAALTNKSWYVKKSGRNAPRL